MTRVCFQLQVRPDRVDEYVQKHEAVWPEMLQAIADAGRRNYSLFLRDDGLRTAAWEAEAAGFFVSLDGGRPDQGAPTLREVFNLEAQLARLGDS